MSTAAAIDILASLTSAALAVTDVMKVAQSLGREPSKEELDKVVADSLAQHEYARRLVELARKREEAAAGATSPPTA